VCKLDEFYNKFICKWDENSIAKVMNSTTNGTKSIAKLVKEKSGHELEIVLHLNTCPNK